MKFNITFDVGDLLLEKDFYQDEEGVLCVKDESTIVEEIREAFIQYVLRNMQADFWNGNKVSNVIKDVIQSNIDIITEKAADKIAKSVIKSKRVAELKKQLEAEEIL